MKILTALKNNLVLIIVVLALVGGMVLAAAVVPSFRITTGSMEPVLPVGTIVFTAPADSLESGEIIAFREEGKDMPVIHAFVDYADDGSLITQGVANPSPDVHSTPLTHNDVIGKVVVVTYIFAPSFWLSQRGVLIVGFTVVGLLLFWWSARIKDDKEDTQDTEEALDEPAKEVLTA